MALIKKGLKKMFSKEKTKEKISENVFLDVHKIYDKPFINWNEILDTNRELWEEALKNKNIGKKILFATSSGGFSHRPFLTLDSLLGAALTLRGASVDFLLCDRALPVCLKAEYELTKPELINHAQLSHTLCRGCYEDSIEAYSPLGLSCHKLNSYITPLERLEAIEISKTISFKKIKHYKKEGISIGEHALAATMRYFARVHIETDPNGETVLRRYFEAALIVYFCIKKLINDHHFDTVCNHNGIYVPHGIIAEVCKKNGINIVTWTIGYRKNTFIFTHDDYITHSWMNEPTKAWENIKWNDRHEKTVMDYLESRRIGNKDWVRVKKDGESTSFLEYAQKKNINLNMPIIGLLTNIIWDAQVAYPSRVFNDMIEWIIKTIQFFKKRKDLQLLIRIHPAESLGHQSQQLALTEINKIFPKLPRNVFIIESGDMIDTYDAMKQCDSVIIYATTTGLELAARGLPIIVAGEAWIRKKGLAYEANTEKEYWKLLKNLPLKASLPIDATCRARKFAFHHFFRRMIPISSLTQTNDYMLYKLAVNKLDSILPGSDSGLDIICDGILEKKSFIYPIENEI